MSMIASDDNNPAFAGAKNPDDALAVVFYDHADVDEWASREKGIKTLKKECPFVRINTPGDNLNIIQRPADARDVNRFPRQWLIYQMETGKIAGTVNVPGWQLQDWPEIDDDLRHKLKFMRFATVEQLAGASDGQLQEIMGGYGFRQKAIAAIQRRNSAAVTEAVAERDAKISAQADAIAAMQAQMAELLARIPAANTEQPSGDAKRGPGRPPRQEANA